MFKIDSFLPTKIIFGNGRLKELAELKLPGTKAIICHGKTVKKLGIIHKVADLLKNNGVDFIVFDEIEPNPTKKSIMKAAAMAKEQKCDFVIGLGGGSSIDASKAIAIMMENPGDLWDYASVGTGGKKEIERASPVVAITTTSGTGTESDPYSVITNEITREKLDFALDAIFPKISIIDPELMDTVPLDLSIYQGFDALFHALECYISNENENRLVDIFAQDSIKTVTKWLPILYMDAKNLEARNHIAYAADILSGYTQALINTTSLHIIAQTMGGLHPNLPHGAALIMLAEQYFLKVILHRYWLLDDIGKFMGETPLNNAKGMSFINALTQLMDQTGVRKLKMSEYGITLDEFEKIVNITVDEVGIDFEKYILTKDDFLDILQKSYR